MNTMYDRKECNNCKFSYREKGLFGLWCKHTLEYVEGYSPKDCEFFEDKRLIFEEGEK